MQLRSSDTDVSSIQEFFACFSNLEKGLNDTVQALKIKAQVALKLLALSSEERRNLEQEINSVPNGYGWAELRIVLRQILTKFVNQLNTGNDQSLLDYVYKQAQGNEIFASIFPSIYLVDVCRQPKERIDQVIAKGFSIDTPFGGSGVICETYSAEDKKEVLAFAVRQNLTHVVSILLEEDSLENGPKDHYNKLLQIAIANSSKEAPTIAQNLIEKGADPNACYSIDSRNLFVPIDINKGLFTTPLQKAVICGNLDMVKILLQSGADPDTASYFYYRKESDTGDKVSAMDVARAIKNDGLRNEIITELAKVSLAKYCSTIDERVLNNGSEHCLPTFTLFGESFHTRSLHLFNKFTAQEKKGMAFAFKSVALYEGDKNSHEYYQILKTLQKIILPIPSCLTSGQLGIIYNDLKESIFHDKSVTRIETQKMLQEIEISLESVFDCAKRNFFSAVS